MCRNSKSEAKSSRPGEILDPSTFAKLMRDKGYQVTVNKVSTPNGKVVEVKVPERELSLMFVTPEVCQ